jgi:hypothetical protein
MPAAGPSEAVAAVGKQEWRHKVKEKGKGGKKSKPWEQLNICKFHYKYGEDRYSCADPAACHWPKEN